VTFYKNILLLILLLITTQTLQSKELPNTENEEEIYAITELEVYEDKEGSITFKDILGGKVGFKKPIQFEQKDYNTNAYYWVKK
jgi:hypothetical protein